MESCATSTMDLIRRRFSCRTYRDEPIDGEKRRSLQAAADSLHAGPLGSSLRFSLVAATEVDRAALKGLGTYGFIKGASGFIVGAVRAAEKDLEDYGYALERLILRATELGLGTCWLGGTFTKSRFARKISAQRGEQVPAVASVGLIAEVEQARQAALRQRVGEDRRLPWERLFFSKGFGTPLTRDEAGEYAAPLEMVRLGPSASNKQPWRIVKDGKAFHFFLQRTPGYGDGLAFKLLRIADLQRIDLGIAMCHFEAAAAELGLGGTWSIREPDVEKPDDRTEYTVSWVS